MSACCDGYAVKTKPQPLKSSQGLFHSPGGGMWQFLEELFRLFASFVCHWYSPLVYRLNPAPCLVSLSLYASEEEMDSATTFGPTIIIPFIASDNLSDTILYGGIVLANADFSTDHFEHFNMLGSAFPSSGMTALSCITHHQLYKHAVFTFLPTPNRTSLRQDRRLC
jgi:hypothetical protein